jgi:hypothetical protein
MPLKPSDKVKANFKFRLIKAVSWHGELMLAVHRKVNQAALETMLVEQFAMLSAVQWESFLNDIIMTYAVMRPRAAIKALQQRVGASVRSRFGERAARCMKFQVKSPVTWDRLVGLLDPKDWNISFTSAEKLRDRVNELLAAEFAKRFSLAKDDAQFFDFAVALRNFLSHRSAASRTALKTAINLFTEAANTPFKANLGNAGTYLKARDSTGTTRAVLFAKRLIDLAGKL